MQTVACFSHCLGGRKGLNQKCNQSVGVRVCCIFIYVHFKRKVSCNITFSKVCYCIFLMKDDMYLHKNSQAH